ncbi:PAS domain-containing sensor histidine kinase [Hymenobacter puniceus]|uniref:PAS domain-containing sensor histidine kinase n=1 Tax=Hymenobacter sp. BT190 TaxID=2763505 RepID=UPI001651AC11|nr:PAS domain-containing sensor histidine kinase [Hymenobacter sp. BT190]MBC6698424.1 PAS domain-containing sensor histidine kinase [Hymenobacter sp. BT190]
MVSGLPPTSPAYSFPDGVLQTLLAVSLTGVNLLRPLYSPDNPDGATIVDFRIDYLNPAAQRITGLPEQPGINALTTFPSIATNGVFDFYCRTFASGAADTFAVNYQSDGLDNYFRLSAQRHGDLLVVSLTDTADQPRGPVEMALREAHARTEQQRAQLEGLFMQAPAALCRLDGPELVFALVNPVYQQLFPGRQLLGLPLLAALPELAEHAVRDILQQVYQSGQTHVDQGVHFSLARTTGGPLTDYYFNYIFQPSLAADGQARGVLVYAFDVTPETLASQQLHRLNQDLEGQVKERTTAALTFQADVLAAAQRQVRERQAFRDVFEQTPALIALLRSPQHRFEYVNPAYQHLFAGRQLVGRELTEAVPELRLLGFVAILDHVYRTGETYFGEEVPFAPAGQEAQPHYYNFTYQAYQEEGEIAGISIFAYDVTAQVGARQEREAQREQLQAVFAQAPVAVCVFRGENSVLDVVNPPMATMLGHALSALVGQPFFEVLPELRSQGLPELLAEVWRTGKPFVAQEQEIQLAHHRPNEPGYYNFVYQPLLDPQGQVTGIVCVATDVSAQVEARRLVEARGESFRLMADNAPAMLWVTDPAGYCTYLNQQWYDFTGQTEAEALGMGWTLAVHPHDAAAAGAAFLDANARRVPFDFLFRLRRHDGHYRWAIDRGLPRFGPDGEFEGIVGTVVDVHEQKLAELALQKLTKKLRVSRDHAESLNAELQTSNRQLVRTNVDLDNFIYTASHDLKAPISNLEGLLHLLHAELPAPAAQDANVAPVFTRLFDSVERFKRTIDHLTEVSKLQKEHAPAADLVDLAAVVEDVRQDLRPLLLETGAQLIIDVAATPPVLFAEKNLRSVVYNLLSNALKYHSPDRTLHIEVRARTQAGYTILEVHDNGLGIAPDQVPRLFTMFQRFHDHVEGTGIGLYMIKRMVENAGGRIEARSQLGTGTTFFVHLPHAAPAAA